MNLSLSLNPNPLVRFLQKKSSEFTKEDIIKYMEANEIQMLNFRYVAEDGRLKSLNFVVSGREHLDAILSAGERVDGSSLFSFMEAGSSDLYVVPRYRTAFLNPFSENPSIEILCSFYDHKGQALESAPENILRKAHNNFMANTGMSMKFLGELEYYVNSERRSIFPGSDQKGYHESEPFAKFEGMRKEALKLIAQCGGQIKYGHAEVGTFTAGNEAYEQHEIEFLPTDPEFAADQMLLAKWVLRMLAEKLDVEISFAPKITVGKAGSGLHFHMLVEKDGKNIMLNDSKLSDVAKRVIAGILDVADALTAFGNTIPTSYLRLVPHQEAPTNICWGDRNRSALVRVPLGWTGGVENMIFDANPNVEVNPASTDSKQTVEFRAPDGSANIHLTIAGLITAAGHGLMMDDSLERAEKLYVSGNIFDKMPEGGLEQLPTSCYESGICLDNKRAIFEQNNIFPERVITHTINKLKAFEDKDLSERLYGKNEAIRELVMEFIHCQ
ncbi:glutamine synthetase family protein [Carboxylicivirga sp. M1479]|uniref:glutamine synthetase family protein n=1 Tax=Carboxylicivirga sp. M1479 TaxID=2594476 RepID=UPI0011787A05|nr:glutamine synthetase family protein [Carboxylicivirga sp. M1479]TRX66039.1 glutamine synthetase [Carboxylicivirga sp. M1479]